MSFSGVFGCLTSVIGNLPGEYLWEPLEALGVDLLNADNLSNTARVPRLQ